MDSPCNPGPAHGFSLLKGSHCAILCFWLWVSASAKNPSGLCVSQGILISLFERCFCEIYVSNFIALDHIWNHALNKLKLCIFFFIIGVFYQIKELITGLDLQLLLFYADVRVSCIASLEDSNPAGTISFLLPGTRRVVPCGKHQGSDETAHRPHTLSSRCLPSEDSCLCQSPSVLVCFFFFFLTSMLKTHLYNKSHFPLLLWHCYVWILLTKIFFPVVPLQTLQPSEKVPQPIPNEHVPLFNWLSTVDTACPCPSHLSDPPGFPQTTFLIFLWLEIPISQVF